MADGKPSAQTDGTKRKALDISTKRVILNELAQGAKNCELVKKYGVSKSTISTILKNKDKIISADANSTDRKRLRRATYADVEEALLKWFVDARARNIPISGPMMLAKAKDFAFLLDFPDFCPGNGWLHRFKVRHGIVFKSIVGEAASASDQDVASWLEANRDTILSYAERDVYNADETALFYQMLPGKTHAMKGDTCAGGKHSKVRVTALLCTNMDGSDRRVPFVIGKSKKPRCFRGYVPVRYRHSAKAWMTRDLFAEWLSELDRDMHKQGRRVLLVVDNCSAHHVQASLTAVTLLFLPPNTTSKVQPLDLGIIRAFKAYYRRRVVERMLIAVDRPAANLPLRVSLYSALEMVKASWAEVTATCVQNCFRKAGFADVGPDADPEASEEDHSGGDLWQRVVDSDVGGRDICWDDFVTADDDADTAEPCTDEGIVNEVRGKSDSEESDDDDDETLEPAPTSVPVAIGYIDSLRQLVYAKGLGEEHAAALNKLETTLIASALSKQTCITDFFAKK